MADVIVDSHMVAELDEVIDHLDGARAAARDLRRQLTGATRREIEDAVPSALSDAQADGRHCVDCDRPFASGIPVLDDGHAVRSHTGSQVFRCEPCLVEDPP